MYFCNIRAPGRSVAADNESCPVAFDHVHDRILVNKDVVTVDSVCCNNIQAGVVGLSADELGLIIESLRVTSDGARLSLEGEAVDVDFVEFVRFLSAEGALDDALLARVQQHLSVRFSK